MRFDAAANADEQTFLYFLVEAGLVKIGVSVSVIERARLVSPSANWDASWALRYPNRRAAMREERNLHDRMRSWHRPQLGRDGGTEFFDIACIDRLKRYLRENEDVQFKDCTIVSGRDLRRLASVVPVMGSLAVASVVDAETSNAQSLAAFEAWVSDLLDTKTGMSLAQDARGGLNVFALETSEPTTLKRAYFEASLRCINPGFDGEYSLKDEFETELHGGRVISRTHLRVDGGRFWECFAPSTPVTAALLAAERQKVLATHFRRGLGALREQLPMLSKGTTHLDAYEAWRAEQAAASTSPSKRRPRP